MVDLLQMVQRMAHNPIRNYVTPGLTSALVGGAEFGKVRLFSCDRDTRDWVTPHSHRFDFTCLVLDGTVLNMLYTSCARSDTSNRFAVGTLKAPEGGLGDYAYEPGTTYEWFEERRELYRVGDTYSMTSDQIHSIEFNRQARVLFFEGPEVTRESKVLEPWSDGARVPTFETRSWMFEREVTALQRACESK